MVSESDRLTLYQGLSSTLGEPQAGTLMELLPTVPWGEIASRDQLDHIAAMLRAEISGVEAGLQNGISRVHSDLMLRISAQEGALAALNVQLGDQRQELLSELGDQRQELLSELGDQRQELLSELGDQRQELLSGLGELRTAIGGMEAQVRGDQALLRSQLHEMHAVMKHDSLRGLLAQVTAAVTMLAALIAIVISLRPR